MAQDENTLPPMTGDDNLSLPDIDAALDDILGNSEILSQAAGESTQEEYEDTADDAEDDDDLVDDESGDEEDEADGDESADDEDADGDDEESTEDDDDEDSDDEADEIDWEFTVPVKVDGEESEVDLKELVKGYQTSQHLSKKGRELANERNEFEEAKGVEMNKVAETARLLTAQTMVHETELATEYKELGEGLKAAKKSKDSYEAEQLQEKMEEVQIEYWKARKTRERIAEAVQAQESNSLQAKFAKNVAKFNEEIGDFVPDFNEERATELREFAISKGISEDILATLSDARVIGALNEFMELSKKVSKGSAKRKAAPKRRPTSTKKAKPASVKKKQKSQAVSKRIQEGKATEEDLEQSLDDIVGSYFG